MGDIMKAIQINSDEGQEIIKYLRESLSIPLHFQKCVIDIDVRKMFFAVSVEYTPASTTDESDD